MEKKLIQSVHKMAQVYEGKKDFSSAIKYYENTLVLAKLYKNEEYQAHVLSSMAAIQGYELKQYNLSILVETGTYLGETIAATCSEFPEIYSIELSDDLYQRASTLFADFPWVHLIYGDSASVLRELLQSPCQRKRIEGPGCAASRQRRNRVGRAGQGSS